MLTAPDASTLRLSAPEVSDITGGLIQPAAQIRAPHAGMLRSDTKKTGAFSISYARA
jgi:hypothetical protein